MAVHSPAGGEDARIVTEDTKDIPRKLSLRTAAGLLGVPSVPLEAFLVIEEILSQCFRSLAIHYFIPSEWFRRANGNCRFLGSICAFLRLVEGIGPGREDLYPSRSLYLSRFYGASQ